MNKTYDTVIKEVQKNQKETLNGVLTSIDEKCQPPAFSGLKQIECRNTELAAQLNKVNQSQRALVGAVKEQADLLTQFSRVPYGQKVPVSSYRMARGSIEHGQYLSLRNLGLNAIRALGPVLTGFVPFFHALNRRSNFSQGINILNNPIEKGFDLLIPDETITQMQRLDDGLLRDGMIIQNNRQFRTRVLFPKDLLKLEGDLRDNPIIVTQALGQMYLIGDTVKFINRVSVTSAGTGEVLPPPRVTPTDLVLTIGGPDTLSVTGTFLEGASLTPDDPINIKVEPPSTTRTSVTARLNISEKANVGSHTFTLTTPGGSTIIPVTFTQPKPELANVNPLDFDSAEPKVNDNPRTEYPFTVTGKFFSGAQIAPANDATKAALELVKSEPDISDGGTKLHGSVRLREGAKAGNYSFNLTNPQNPDKITALSIPVKKQEPTSITESEVRLTGETPPAHSKSQIDLIIPGENLYNAKLELAAPDKDKGVTITGVDNKDQKTLTAHITVDERAAARNYTLNLTNESGDLKDLKTLPFTVGPQEDIVGATITSEQIAATGEEQRVSIVITGSNLLAMKEVTFSTTPDGAAKQLSWQQDQKNSLHESNGDKLVLDVKVPAAIQAGDKVTIKLRNSNNKEVAVETEIVAPATPAPTIAGFLVNGETVATASGKVGDPIVILGNNLKDPTVTFGTNAVTPTEATEDQISFKVPEGATGEVVIKIKTAGGEATTSKFTVTPP